MRLKFVSSVIFVLVVLGFVPAWGAESGVEVYFDRDVMPVISSVGCNSSQCHGAVGGKGGFELSMFGADVEGDFESITRGGEGREINRIEPAKSLFVLKATGSIAHGGGKKIAAGSAEQKLLEAWIRQGARLRDPKAAKLVGVKASPEKKYLKKGGWFSISVRAEYSDGSAKDVTKLAQFQMVHEGVAVVDGKGKVETKEFGEGIVIASYMRKHDLVRVLVPQKLGDGLGEVRIKNKVDEHVANKLRELGIWPSDNCSDHVFVRRLYMDVTGRLPLADEVRSFLEDDDWKKRDKLIDRLLSSEEYADFQALKWGDLLRIKSEYPSNLWPNAVQAYYKWIHNSIARNKPYDKFARELLVSGGSNFRSSEVNFYRAFLKRDAQSLGDAAVLVFMGARIQCARCHGHPVEEWTLDDNLATAAFFAKVGYKRTAEWKEEIIYNNPKGSLSKPSTREVINPAFFGGEALELKWGEDPRVKFADWLIAEGNPWFAKNIVNRIWFWLMGRGIVHEVDDLRPSNPPSNVELIAYLEKELVEHDYDLKHIFGLILNSQTYQRSSKSNEWNAWDDVNFSHYQARRLSAEQLLDAMGQITGVWDKFSSRVPEPFTFLPTGHRSVQLADGSIGSSVLELFGRPSRDSAYESERSCETSMRQALHFINSSHLEGKIAGSPKLKELIKAQKDNNKLVEEIYLVTVSRFPTDGERRIVLDFIGDDPKKRTVAIQDFLWAMMNTKEFLFNH